MNTYIFLVGGILILTILFFLLRIGNLLNVFKQERSIWETSDNRKNAWMMLLFLIFFIVGFWWYFFHSAKDLLPESASVHGIKSDHLFYVVTAVILVPFVVLNILLFWAAFRFRYNKNRRAKFNPDNSKLEMIWTIVPALVFTSLILKGSQLWEEIKSPAPVGSEVIEIMGFQFGWKVRYPGSDHHLAMHNVRMIDPSNEFGMDLSDKNAFDDFITNEIHIPKGKPVLLKIWSRDVIHSVFAPHFRLKMDAVPGMETQFWFTPMLSTQEMQEKLHKPEFNYEVACTEVCGKGHFAMRMKLVVDEPAKYELWKTAQESWLKSNPEYLTRVPENLREAAIIKSGIEASNSKTLNASF